VDQGTQHTYLESVGDRFGNVLKITRTTDPSHRITRIDSPNGRPVHFSYELVPPDDEVHRITQISDSIGRTVTYTYHPTGDAGADRLKRVTDAGGHTTDYTYYGGTNTCRDMKTITDSRHIPYLENIYFEPDDPSFTGNGGTYKEHVCAVKKQKGPDIPGVGQAVWEFDYMENEDCTLFLPGNVCSPEESWIVETTVTDPRGRRDQYRWDSGPETLVGGDTDLQHEPAAQPRGLLRHTAGVNLATNQQRTTLINGGPPNGTNDGLITSIEDFLDRTTALTYETVPVVLADGSTWNKPTANVTSVSVLDGTPNERQWQYTYEPSYGQLKTTTDPLGHTTTLLYDTQASLTGVLDASGVQTGITLHPSGHDAAGRVATASTYESAGGGGGNPPTNTWHFDYELGHLTSITDPAGQVTRRFIDEGGRVVAVTDALGRTTEFGWSARNQLEEVLDPLGAKTVIGYDENGNLTSMKDANDHTTTFTYTEADELETRVDALGQMESFVHDVNGNLVQHTDRRGYVTDFAYDDHDRWETSMFKTSAGATVSTIDVTYDRNGATQSEDVTLTDSKIAGTFVLDFNQFDELIWAGGPNGEVRYEYDDAGRRETLRWPGPNEAAAYTYDTANRVRQIDMANSGTPLGTVLMTYDAAGRLDLVTLPNGMVMDHAYDAVSRLTGITYKTVGGTVAGSVTYAYDAAGRRRQIGGTWSPLQLPDAVTSAVYNANNQLTQWNGEAFTYAYDANGNLQILPGVLLTWNERNELSKVQWPFASPARTWDYRYDPYGRRHEELDNGTSTRRYVYDGWNPVRIATQYPGNERLLSGPGLDAWLVKWDAFGARQAFLSDGLGSTVKLAADDGSYPATFSYTPFGKTTVAGSSWERMRYTGREQDPHGFYYYRGRYYDPVRSRFLSDDPIGFAGGDPNLYAYVGNDPLNFVDPTGEWGWIGVAAAAAQIAGAASAAGAAAGVLSGRKSAGGAAAGAALGAGLGAAGGALGRLAARGAGRLLSGGAARGARFVTNAAGETRIFLRGAEGTLEVSSHAAQRITQRGLSLDAVEEVISAQNPFQYFHNGVWKTGFYDPASQVFVGSANGTIRTVIPGATQNYINNLLGALP
jgi:RHS repeat-associated protein